MSATVSSRRNDADRTAELTALHEAAREARRLAVRAWMDLMDVTDFAEGALKAGYWDVDAGAAARSADQAKDALAAALSALERAREQVRAL